MTEKSDTLIALESFIGHDGKEERMFRQGDVVRGSDPAVKKWPTRFGVPRYLNEPRVEQATAAPGERR